MRTRAAAVLVVVVAVVAWAKPAAAKGMSSATIEGEGIAEPLAYKMGGGGDLAYDSGVYELIWETSPSYALDRSPTDDLGPKVTIRWMLMGPNGDVPVLQDVYPYADGGPVTFVAAGQPMWDGSRTSGGWFRAPARLTTTLVDLGVPARTALEPARSGADPMPWAPIGASVVAMVVLVTALAVIWRRRGQVAPAAG
jgi:hypothetical protein